MASRQIAINIRVIGDGSGADQVTTALKRTQVETDRLTQLQAGLTNSFLIGNLAARAISVTFYAVKDALTSAAKAGVDFEFSMAKFRAITGSSIELTNDLSHAVRELALATGQSQEELAKTSLEMAKMGLSASQVESILPNVAKLARGLDEDLVATGKAVVFMLNAYGISAQEAEKITNELGYSVKISALDIQSFSTAFQYVGATARLAGVSIETLQASMDVLSNAGIRASTIGTQLRRVITDLGNENSKAAKLIGGTIESYGSLEKALDAVAAKHLDAGGMAAIFGRNASSTADILVRYRNVISEVAEDTGKATTASGQMNDIIQNTLKGSIDRLAASWKDLGIEILSSNSELKAFIDLLGKAISHITKFESDKHRVQDFAAKDPEGYKKAFGELYGDKGSPSGMANADRVVGFGMSNEDVLGTNAYLSFKAKQDIKTFVDKTKDDIQQAILESLDASQAKGYAGKTIPSDLYFKPKNQGRFDYLASLYTDGEDQVNFLKAWHDASVKLVQRVEEGEDKNPLSDTKGDKKAAKFLNMYLASSEGTFSLGESGYDASTFPNQFGKYPNQVGNKRPFLGTDGEADLSKGLNLNNLSGLSKKSLEEMHKDFGPLRKDIEAYTKLMSEAAVQTHAAKLAFDLFSVSSKQLTDKLGTQMIESLARGKNAFKDFDDFFGEFTKNLLAQIASLILQFIILRTVMAAIGIASTGGFGFAGVASGSILNGFLTGLSGTNTGSNPPPHATGGSFVTTGQQSLLVGESGRERVTIMPASKVATNASSGSTGLTVVIQGDVHDYKNFQRKVKSAIARNKKDFI